MKRHAPDSRAAGDAASKAALRAEFPGWSIIKTDRGRWWATRHPEVDPRTRRLVMHEVSTVDADTADELREKLREVGS